MHDLNIRNTDTGKIRSLEDLRPLGFRYAMRLTHYRPDDAEDIVQDAEINAFRACSDGKFSGNLESWYYRIVFRCFLTWKDKFDRTNSIIDQGGDISDRHEMLAILPKDNELSPEGSALANLREQVLKDAIRHVPKVYREVLILNHLENLSYEEIADRLEIPIGTVRSRLNRGREILGNKLRSNGYFDEDELVDTENRQ